MIKTSEMHLVFIEMTFWGCFILHVGTYRMSLSVLGSCLPMLLNGLGDLRWGTLG